MNRAVWTHAYRRPPCRQADRRKPVVHLKTATASCKIICLTVIPKEKRSGARQRRPGADMCLSKCVDRLFSLSRALEFARADRLLESCLVGVTHGVATTVSYSLPVGGGARKKTKRTETNITGWISQRIGSISASVRVNGTRWARPGVCDVMCT